MIRGGLLVVVGASVALSAATMSSGDASRLGRSLIQVLPIALIPAAWMVVQLLPIPGISVPAPIGGPASLGEPVTGRMTVDSAATAMALGSYLVMLSIVLTSAMLTLQRRSAAWMLSLLTTVTAGMALASIVHDVGGMTFLGDPRGTLRTAFDTAAAIGSVTALASAAAAGARFEGGRGSRLNGLALFRRISGALLALLLCAVAVGYLQGGLLLVAAASGALTFGVVLAVRRTGRTGWVGALLVAAGLGVPGMLLAAQGGSGSGPLALRFAQASPENIAVARRILADTPLTGSGAGTFTGLQAAYRDGGDPGSATAPTAMTAVAVEFGIAAPWIVIVLALWAAAVLGRGALRRARDPAYAAAAAGCVVLLTFTAFRDASVTSPGVTMLAALALGLGLAQSQDGSIALGRGPGV
ncbi:hypothetical protein CH341_13185 [Rhodoplanes roseus]|uniref:O-antigen polymerase n=2 Tax=Rhodoplanes roseus TaxID=29409 RepID=A0A327KXV3_9BRAD|nr:hypothetical protein CH341_13185 [Rhodoplanes roseus]